MEYDVIVVGSGPGGGISAYVLASRGLKVALIEAGGKLRAGIDYNAHHTGWDHLEKRLRQGRRNPISSVWGDYAEKNHFTPVGDRPAHGLLRALGGRSLCWAGHTLRFGPQDFARWPIPYSEVAPFYSRAERFMQVHGRRDGLKNMPDGEFQKPVPMRCPENTLKSGVDRLRRGGREMAFVEMRKAIPTESRPGGRTVCHYCGHCMKGCEVDSKYTSANTPIPKALKTGNLTVITEAMMTRILHDRERNRITGIEYIAGNGQLTGLKCKSLVLSCSTVETARLLLVNQLANSSGLVGKNLMSHFGTWVIGTFESMRGRDISNDDGTDYFHSLLTGLYWEKPSKKFEGTYQVQCGAGVVPRSSRIGWVPGYGAELKRQLKDISITHAGMNMQGMMLPSAGTFVDLDPEKKDRFGLPLPRVHLRYGENEVNMAKDMVETCEEIIHAAGGKTYQKPAEISARTLIIDSNHWVGTCRMSRSAKEGVVNLDGQSHDIPNLFIGDASVFAAYPEKNPTLTNIALSWRMSERLADKARKGEL
jgi:choline dehydrogenase-like flavoprotein